MDAKQASIHVLPFTKFGAEVIGLDLRDILGESTRRQLRLYLARYQFLVFREQYISPVDQVRVTRYFGELEPSIKRRPESHQVPGYPSVLLLSNKPGSPTNNYGMAWHSDGLAYAKRPHGATVLYCLDCPPEVGQTLFANQYLSYQSIPRYLRNTLHNMYWELPEIEFSEVPCGKSLIQPMVRVHWQTGRKFLFCSPSTDQIYGMSKAQSYDILRRIHAHQVKETFIYSHNWRKFDLVVWENCTLLHNRANTVEYETQGLRVMHRTATIGDLEAVECVGTES